MDEFTRLVTVVNALTLRVAALESLHAEEVRSLTSQIGVLRAKIEDMETPREPVMAVSAPAKGRKAR